MSRPTNKDTGFRPWWRRAIGSFLCILATLQGADAQTPQALPKLVICPPGDRLRDLFQHPDQWTQARTMTGAILHADHNLTQFTDAELRTWFAMMRQWNITLELEVGAIKEWGPTADETFRAEQPGWDRAVRLGADLASIVMDEPLTASRYLHKADSYAVEQTARFIGLVRQHYPKMRIGDVEPYPGVPLQDHVTWQGQLMSQLRAQNIAPLDFYRADVDWVSFTKAHHGSWQEVGSLAAATRQSGLPFSLIYWASAYPSDKAAGLVRDDAWYVQVLGQGTAVAEAGIHPDQFVLESWINTPDQIVPESAASSFTRSVLDFSRKFLNSNNLGQENRLR